MTVMPSSRSWWRKFASELPLVPSLAVGFLFLLAAALLDLATGPELASAAFYLPAILWLTWKGGPRVGLGTAFACGATWLLISFVTRSNHMLLVLCWNATVRTVTFSLVSGLQSEIFRRIRAEEKLTQINLERQKQADILESVLNSMRDGVLVADSAGKLLHINPAARRLLQIPRDAAGDLDFLRTTADVATKAAKEENPLMRAARGEHVDEAEILLSAPAGNEGVWLSVTGRPLRNPGGTITGGVVVFTDISARKRFERQIADASNREQRRLGEDLHDGLCQQLVSAAFAARGLAAKLTDHKLSEAGDAERIAEMISSSIGQARDVARGLCLVPLETGGLASALEELAMRTRTQHGVACQFFENAPAPDLDEAVATNLFRIAQEGVTNAVKHGRAAEIKITLSADQRQIRLEVADNGSGVSPADGRGKGMGMHLMNYRARTVGASFGVEPRVGGGTVLSCSVPRATLNEQLTPAYGDEG